MDLALSAYTEKELTEYLYISRETSCFLSFQTLDIAQCFMENFMDLIIKAGDLV